MLYIVLIVTIIFIFILLLDLLIARMYRNERAPHHLTPAKYGISY